MDNTNAPAPSPLPHTALPWEAVKDAAWGWCVKSTTSTVRDAMDGKYKPSIVAFKLKKPNAELIADSVNSLPGLRGALERIDKSVFRAELNELTLSQALQNIAGILNESRALLSPHAETESNPATPTSERD